VEAALDAWVDMVCSVVLAARLEKAPAPAGAFAQEWDINGKKAALSVRKA